MIPEIKNILYTTDLSENARYAYGYAASLAQQYNARVTILYVIEELTGSAKRMVSDILGEDRLRLLKDKKEHKYANNIERKLNAFCDEIGSELDACTFRVEKIIVKEGIPVDEILNQAEINSADVIVMGSRGYGLVADALIGGTTRRVIRRSRIPVLVVRLPEEA
jgi:nucleotide-binding universal stress UspA family protein